MRLSWNEIRARAAEFSREWAGARYERAEAQTFYNEFFGAFGISRRRVASFEEPVRKLGGRRGYIDLLWKGVLLVEHKSAGANLLRAREQALDYFPGLREEELPRYLLISDFQTFELQDMESGEKALIPLASLSEHVEKFGFLLGVERRSFREQDPVNIMASERLGRFHEAMERSSYGGHNLEQYLVRILFCLFADDTGIFPRGAFANLIHERTRTDGSDLGPWIAKLFQTLNTPENARGGLLDEDIAAFPHVNGDLFLSNLPIPDFNSAMRSALLDACSFDWGAVSPAIFGALFQSVMDRDKRRRLGAHYTTETNILKLIEPLFMDNLREEFATLKASRGPRRKQRLAAFRQRLGRLCFFDPACGCGNFLIIAYRELRELEIEVLREMHPGKEQELDVRILSEIDVDQFYGIEIEEFPARIAEVALWMMDHIMNNRLSLEFGRSYMRIPLRKSPRIVHGDALECDWNEILPARRCDFLLGNPPFVGASNRNAVQREQIRRISGAGTLDYVAAWFLKAGAYVQRSGAQIAFVATNSITQGEQVARLWPLLFDQFKLEILFAHRTFAWGSDARGKAHVHVVIIGLGRKKGAAPQKRRLFWYSSPEGGAEEIRCDALTPYLLDAAGLQNSNLVVRESANPINGMPKPVMGSKVVDGGNYIFDEAGRARFLAAEPGAGKFMRPYIGAKEYLRGEKRWILSLQDASPAELRALPRVSRRMRAVREFRSNSQKAATRKLAETPADYENNVIPKQPFLLIPETSSERREYVPIGWIRPPAIPSNATRILPGANHATFALLTSKMHMAWLRHIGGRLESRYRYSTSMVYNTFPCPKLTPAQRAKLNRLAEAVLQARARYRSSTLADLYDPDTMPPPLRRAHRALDTAVDKLYRRDPFQFERERIEHLFRRYERLAAPLSPRPARRRARRA